MPAPLRVILTEADDQMLSELRVATTVPQRTRDRAHMLRLNAQGWNVPDIAEMFDCHEHTVRATIKRWQERGLSGLWEAPGRGAKRRWSDADMAFIEDCLTDETRTYNSAQLSRKLREERLVNLSGGQLRDILKKKTIDGNGLVTVIANSKTGSNEQPSRLT
jgi:transposase